MPEHSTTESTSSPESGDTSESEQMYLITVARAGEEGRSGPVPMAGIAGELSVSVASANQMIRKLADRGLVAYEPYRGVELTAAGSRIADQVLRTRRLWARFLADHLGFSPGAADDQACHLEHVTTPDAADRLAEYLGNPEAGPLGRPIPSGRAAADARRPHARLSDMAVGTSAEVVATTSDDRSREFLLAEGLVPGVVVTVRGAGESGWLVDVDDAIVHLAPDLAKTVEVELKEEP